jgi:multiple sugar transport system substrate-binding protein
VWWSGQADEPQRALEKLAKDFEAMHPNVHIEASSGASTTDELLTKMSAGFAAGQYPDISYAFGSWASELGASGKTLDITDQVTQADVKWDEFPKAAQLTASPGGKTIGFPAVVGNLSLFYNPDLFDKAGLDYPTPDWTWDDYRAAAKTCTDPAAKVYGTSYPVSGSEDTTWRFWPLLWQNGGAVLSDDEKSAAFDSDAGVKALEFLRAMAVDDKSVYLDQTDEKYGTLFKDGQTCMMISGPWQLYDLVTAGSSYAVQVLPGTDGDHQTVSGQDLWVLLDHDDANRAHWSYEFAKWLTTAGIDEQVNLAQGNLPLRSSAAGTPGFEAFVTEYPGADVAFANMANATTPRPTVKGYVGLSAAIGEQISAVLQGGAQPKEALDKAAADADKALAKAS